MGIPHGLQSDLSLILWGWLIFSCSVYWSTQQCAGSPFRATVAGPQEENTFVLKRLAGYFWSKEEGRKRFNDSKKLCTKDLRRKYGWHNFWNILKISLKNQIFLCTSNSFVFNEEGTYAESRGINFKIPKEQYQRIWIYLKLSLKSDLEYERAFQWSNNENSFYTFLFPFSSIMSLMPQISYSFLHKKIQICVYLESCTGLDFIRQKCSKFLTYVQLTFVSWKCSEY